MSKDEIMQAFRLIAMGRAGHPLQEQLADQLVKLFAERALVIEPAKRITKPKAE